MAHIGGVSFTVDGERSFRERNVCVCRAIVKYNALGREQSPDSLRADVDTNANPAVRIFLVSFRVRRASIEKLSPIDRSYLATVIYSWPAPELPETERQSNVRYEREN